MVACTGLELPQFGQARTVGAGDSKSRLIVDAFSEAAVDDGVDGVMIAQWGRRRGRSCFWLGIDERLHGHG